MARTPRIRSTRKALAWLLLSPAVFFFSGCIGRPDVSPGGVCPSEGEAKPAPDGCNTCTCSGGTWACTEKACVDACEDGDTKGSGCNACVCQAGEWSCTLQLCPPPGDECFEGEEKSAEDGCNTCSCSDGKWLCTERACIEPSCDDGDIKLSDDGCNSCSCSGGEWACTNRVCTELKCQDGDSEPSGDGCNTCSCSQGFWICTDRACPECQEGERNSDGCNECTCSGGFWACTTRACEEERGCGGWLGDTCTEGEYCAYTESELCGAADASSVCKPRPDICPTVDEPVCGCDGKEYSNSCLAAQSGTGVYRAGGCQ